MSGEETIDGGEGEQGEGNVVSPDRTELMNFTNDGESVHQRNLKTLLENSRHQNEVEVEEITDRRGKQIDRIGSMTKRWIAKDDHVAETAGDAERPKDESEPTIQLRRNVQKNRIDFDVDAHWQS